MNKEFDYYLIYNTGEPNVPLLMNNDDYDVDGIDFIYLDEYTQIEKPVYLALNPPVPPKPNLDVDYFQLPSAVFSQKIFDVLSPLNIQGYQMVPAVIIDTKKNEHKNFWIENAYTRIKCFDDNESVYKTSLLSKSWTNIEKIVIKKDLLMNINLENRLIFRSLEARQFVFYHKSIVDAIMSINPVNIKFTSIEDWYEGVQFRY